MINISSDNIVFGVVVCVCAYARGCCHVTEMSFNTITPCSKPINNNQTCSNMARAVSSSELTLGLNFKNHIKFTIKADYHHHWLVVKGLREHKQTVSS